MKGQDLWSRGSRRPSRRGPFPQTSAELLGKVLGQFQRILDFLGVDVVEMDATCHAYCGLDFRCEFLGELVTSKLRYYPTVTREAYEHTGRVTDLIDSGKLSEDLQLPPLDPAHDRVMICGSPGMLRDLKTMLEQRGFKEGSTSAPGDFVIERAFVEQ